MQSASRRRLSGAEVTLNSRARHLLSLGPLLLLLLNLGGCANLQWPSFLNLGGAPPPTEAETSALAAATVDPKDPAYRIGPEDALEISVWKDDSLKSTTLVRPDGGISFPLVGDLAVAGKTASEVRAEIAKGLLRYMPEPEVTVSVVRVASYRVYVIGRVNKPGDIAVGRPLDVLQALTMAGGMTPFAAEEGIRIIRRVNGQQVAIPFDYSRLRKGGDLAQNITLRSGDVLFVP
jgi:polysaccharide biosynthesis/export protein